MSSEMDTAALQEMAALMESRANVYKVLSKCFREEVDAVFAKEFAEDFVFESSNDELVRKSNNMRELLSKVDNESLEQLAVVFDRVFFGMGPITARHAFPYESVYTSDKGIMMQDAYVQVVRTYREQHLAKDSSFTEPEDHIAVELAFVATLSDRTATFLSEGHEDAANETVVQQKAFIESHLLNWIDMFCVDLTKAAGEGFYSELAQFTELFIHEDAALLGEMLD